MGIASQSLPLRSATSSRGRDSDSQTFAALGILPHSLLGANVDLSLSERLFDCARDTLFFVKNRQARYVAVNRTLAERCGDGSKASLIGQTAIDLFPAPFGISYYEQDRQVLDQGVEIRDRLQLVPHGDQSWGWTLSYKFPLPDAQGRIVGLCGVCKDVTSPEHSRAGFAEVARAIDYIQQHYAEPLRIEALARIAGLGTRRLERLIKRLFHLTPSQLLAKTRIEAAVRELSLSAASVADVAGACGYSDQSAFTRQFRSVVGLTPTQYRASCTIDSVAKPVAMPAIAV